MSSLKFAVLCVLTAYLLVVAFNFITKLRDARLMQKLLCMLFPISQICLIAFPLACSARYGLSAAVYVSLIVLGIAQGDFQDTMRKAALVCYECIGIG